MEKILNSNLTETESNTRNIGIDLLRIVSMLMVVILHILGHGGIIETCPPLSLNHDLTWLLRIICFGAVDLFALTTGYVYAKQNFKYSKIIMLWLSVLFYSAGIALIYFLFTDVYIGIKTLIKSFLPIMTKQYWYFTAYFCLFLFIPFINKLLSGLSKNNYKKLILIGLCAFCIVAWLGIMFGIDTFGLGNGYSFLWLMFLYLIGAYIKTYEIDFKKHSKNKHILLFVITCLTTYILSTILDIVKYKISGSFGSRTTLICYISPFIVFASIQLFLFFSKLQLTKYSKIITKISLASFGIYLISEHPIIRANFITDKFCNVASDSYFTIIPKILIYAILIYIICTIIEFGRLYLFKKINLSSYCESIINKNKKLYKKLINKIP